MEADNRGAALGQGDRLCSTSHLSLEFPLGVRREATQAA
jgi:hypothetical protein